jgi:hypothetical protein
MMLLSEPKARESGRWDRRIQNLDHAIDLFQVIGFFLMARVIVVPAVCSWLRQSVVIKAHLFNGRPILHLILFVKRVGLIWPVVFGEKSKLFSIRVRISVQRNRIWQFHQ